MPESLKAMDFLDLPLSASKSQEQLTLVMLDFPAGHVEEQGHFMKCSIAGTVGGLLSGKVHTTG